MKINTVLFDLDGTLIDTNDLIIASFKHTFQHFLPYEEKEFDESDLKPFIGEPLIDTFRRIDEQRARDMFHMYRKHNAENHDLLIKEFDGVYETVAELKRLGVNIAVVTNKVRESALKGLELTRLEPFFDVVVAVDDVTQAKPHAEPILKAMEELQAEPISTIMVGDSQFDIQAGKNAGTYTAGVAWSLKGREFIEHLQPDYVIEHMSEILKIVEVKA